MLLCLTAGLDFSSVALENSDDVGVVDYSFLTQNQYISKILLNCNYLGSANDYNPESPTPESQQLEYLIDPNNVSFSRILVNALQENSDFMSSVEAWEFLTFNPKDLAEDAFKEEDYYTTVLLSILDAKVNDNEFIKGLNCSANKTITSLSKSTAKILKEFSDIDIESLENVNVDELTHSQYNDLMEQIVQTKEVKDLYNAVGNDIGYISDATKLCKTVSDIVKTVSMYSEINETSKATQAVLKSICDNCPTDNAAIHSASQKVYEYVTGALTENMLTMMECGEAVFSTAFDEIVGKLWSAALTTTLGSFGTGVLIGQAVGKAIGNFAFSTDATIDKYYAMNALVQFEDIIVSCVSDLSEYYNNNETSENADNYLRSIELMLATYNLGCDYTNDFVEIVFEKGLVNSIKNMFGKSQTPTNMKSSITSMKCCIELAYGLVSIDSYKYYLHEDALALYEAIYGNDSSGEIPIREMEITQKADLMIGDEGFTCDFFSVNYLPQDNTEIAFGETVTSSDEKIITVDSGSCMGGYITAVGKGTCTLTFTSYNGKTSASIEVNVKDPFGTDVFEFGDGSQYNPYQVSTPRQLNAVRNDLSAYYIQICDIDMLNWKEWEPIGTEDNPFTGGYDGNNYFIKNLNIEINDEHESIECVGLFGKSTRTLKNIHLIDFSCSVLKNCKCVGSICGEANTINNCTSNGEIDAYCIKGGGIAGNATTVTDCVNYIKCRFYYTAKTDNYCYYGGICATTSEINKSANKGTIYTDVTSAGCIYTGGIVGYSAKVSLCHNESYLETRLAKSNGEAHLGGIVGYTSKVDNCYNLGDLYAKSNYAIIIGGIVSRSFGCTVTDCYSLQSISGFTPSYPGRHYGGIIGYSTVSSTYVNNCYYNYSSLCNTKKYHNNGSKQLTNEQFILKSSFEGFDFVNVWKICENYNNGKPFLLKSPLHNWNYGEVISPASCSETGLKLYSCSCCGLTFEEIIPITDHRFVLNKETPSTCNSSGLQEYVCIYCGEKKTVITNQTEHFFKDYQSDNNATCTKNGTKTSYCEYGCGQSSTIEDENSALGHTYTTLVTEPTCTEKGKITYTCTNCDNSYTEIIEPLGHTEATDAAVAATCTATGKTEGSHCSVCDEILVAQKTVKAKGHKEIVIKGTPATFKTSGNTDGKKCKTCGKVLVAQKSIAKLGSPSLRSLTAQSKGFKATWKSVASIDGYQIQCSISSSFKSGNKTVTVKGYKSTAKTIKSLKAKKKYYVHIRAYKTINGKKQYSAWSKSKTVTTKQ